MASCSAPHAASAWVCKAAFDGDDAMNWFAILLAALAAACAYLASPHQRLWQAARAHPTLLRWLALPFAATAVAVAAAAQGGWCGAFVAMSGAMAALVALPYLDAWLHRHRPTETRHAR
jgi:apolipoprotein N-acyltransferase